MARKIPVLPALAGVAAAMVYKAACGHGVFNTLRFHKEHDAVKRYVAAHYPGARYSLLGQTDGGLGKASRRKMRFCGKADRVIFNTIKKEDCLNSPLFAGR